MSDNPTKKIQPWKTMKTMEEDLNPDFDKLQGFQLLKPDPETNPKPPHPGSGASVSRPMDRKTGFGEPEKVVSEEVKAFDAIKSFEEVEASEK